MENKLFASIKTMLTSMFGMDEDSTVQEVHQRLSDEDTLITAAVKEAEANTRETVEGESQEQIDQLNAQIAELTENNNTLITANTNLQTELDTANEQIETLSAEGDGTQAAGETVPPKGTKKKSWEDTPINKKVAAMRAAWRKAD